MKGIFTLEELKNAGLDNLDEKKGIWTREEVEKLVGREFDDEELLGGKMGIKASNVTPIVVETRSANEEDEEDEDTEE